METAASATTMEDCCVKVAVHIRPLIGDEKLQACKDCVAVVPGKPQVQLGTHSFTFDHVYGSTGTPSSAMFEECVSPLVDGLFQGYNATVLAYGQTGSGKTYTMGSGCKDGAQTGLIPQAMSALFNKIESLKHQIEFQLHVSFIEILKEEVRDLLDPNSSNKSESPNGQNGKVNIPGKPPIQIRETSNGVITLAGSTECGVQTLKEMADCLEHGSLSRATGSTNMNNQSSRSHAIFTITVEQIRKGDSNSNDSMGDEYLCAKLHLVDLAGSERAKRTGSDGMRFKEGVHINKGLLALGNVISALGDEKKRKEGAHVPYRDSKLTRLLQDSLGGNSRTVMIACVSPADINAEETLNTLKYANRARNIQNKPVVNRDPMSSEMLKMRQQLECLQAELCARGGGSSVELQVLRERIAWLEATNQDLCRELHVYRSRGIAIDHSEMDTKGDDSFCLENEGIKRSLQSSVDSSDYQMSESGDSTGIDEEAAKEWEHTLLQDSMDKELHELNKRLEQKESEMKLFGGFDTMTLKQHFGKKIMELEDEKRAVQKERDRLQTEIENLSATSDGQTQKLQDLHSHKLKSLESQILDLKKKKDSQVQIMKQKQKSDEAAKKLQDEIQFIKAQKVQLQHRIKQEAEQFRQWKASREKELLQLKKEGRRNEYERHKLQALNQRQKMVLQRKTEEAAMATKRLKELLEARKSTKPSIILQKKMEGGVAAEQGTVTCASWIRRPEEAHLVALGKSKHGNFPASFQIFTFDRLTTSLSSSPSATFEFEDGCDPVSLAVHPSGDDIICSTTKGGCRVFELHDQEKNLKLLAKELKPLQNVGPQKCLAFSTDGSRFAAGGVDGHLRIYEWPSMRVIVDQPKAHQGFNDMDFSLDSEFLASTSTDGSARIWNANDGVPVNSLTRTSDEKIELCRFSKDGTKPFLFCTVQKGNRSITVVWDISTWDKIGFKRLLRKPACVMSISLDGKYLAQGSKDGDVCVVSVKKMEVCHWSKRLHLGYPVSSLDFCPSERVVLSTSNEWGAMVTKLNVPADWKEWQLYMLLIGLFLASAVLFYIFFENSDLFWNLPMAKDQPARPKLGSYVGDHQSDDKNMWGPVDM